ncbi:DUF1640 domain-containing protein [Ramlibacter albus]|uniref:DUF1640 domain-containing protein n=1 Tax=Ramlibacter albus TaxID=2079448 RepID=A0A923MBS8_9BURK|nr:DUF1640 domain-containing protein [Ramlibacter albus]MBC5767296.1 DUF1640 domain-containing protein [Ramlibacter albus]
MTHENDTQPAANYDADMDHRMTMLEAKWDAILPTLATKSDVAELRTELRTEMQKGFGEVRAEVHKEIGGMRTEIQEVRTEIHREVGQVRAEIQKGINETQRWMIATVIGLFIGFAGLFLAMTNTLRPQAVAVSAPAR